MECGAVVSSSFSSSGSGSLASSLVRRLRAVGVGPGEEESSVCAS